MEGKELRTLVERAALYAARLIAYAPEWAAGVQRYQGAAVILSLTPRRRLRKVEVKLQGIKSPVVAYEWDDRIAVEFANLRGAVLQGDAGDFVLVWFDGRKAKDQTEE